MSLTRRGVRCWAGVLFFAVISVDAAAKGPDDYEQLLRRKSEGVVEEKVWSEGAHQLPPLPDPANLIRIDVSAHTSNSFAVDEQSVTYGEDEVIRYTLVITSPSGARNVSYEGMRCATAERRVYAFVGSGGGWAPTRNSAWVRIQENGLNRHHAALFREYFCSSGGSVMDTAQARRVLPNGNPAAPGRGR
jgi:hypothetical protein